MGGEVEGLAGCLDGFGRVGPGETDAGDRDEQFDAEQAVAAGHGVEQAGFGFAEGGLGVAAGEQVARRQEVRFDDPLHFAGARSPGADLVEVGRWISALGEVDASEHRVLSRGIEVHDVLAGCCQTVVGESAGGGDVAQVQVMARMLRAPEPVHRFTLQPGGGCEVGARRGNIAQAMKGVGSKSQGTNSVMVNLRSFGMVQGLGSKHPCFAKPVQV